MFPHIGDPDEQFGTHNKLPWVSKVGQKISQTKYVSVKKLYENACIKVPAVFENMLPDDISTPHTETRSVMRMHGRMRMRIYRQTYGYADRSFKTTSI